MNSIIHYYNRLNGNSISIERLKEFRVRVEKHIESNGTGPHMIDLKGILSRVGKAIKNMIDQGAEVAERVELVPIEIKSSSLGNLNTAKTKKGKENQRKSVFAKLSDEGKIFIKNQKGKRSKKTTDTVIRKTYAKVLKQTSSSTEFNKKYSQAARQIESGKVPDILTKKSKGITASSLAGMDFKTLAFDGKWKNHIGIPSENFSAMVWGKPKQGKTHYSFQFANYLTQFGTVLYILSDEGIGYTVKDKIIANGLDKNEKVSFLETREIREIESAIKSGNYKFVFIDLIGNIRNGDEPLTHDDFYNLRKRHANVSFIPVFASTKNGTFKGPNEWGHDVDVLVEVEEGHATAKGRFGGGEYEIFNKSKSKTDV